MAVTFDGSSGLTFSGQLKGITDSKTGTILLWAKLLADDGTTAKVILTSEGASGSFQLFRINEAVTDGSKLRLVLKDSSDNNILVLQTSTEWTAETWQVFAISYDLENSLAYVYNGNTDVSELNTNPTDVEVDLTVDNWYLGNLSDYEYDGSLATIAFWPGVYVDLTDDDERRNLISNDGKPVGFGFDGSGRGGRDGLDTQPVILFSGAFVRNYGTGGAFSTVGTLSHVKGPDTYRASSDRLTYGTRWYDSERSGWSYPRNEMLRERFGKKGQRVGFDESDEPDRDDFKEVDFMDLVADEEDHEDVL